jgi:Flp pilus assembly protein TadD
MSVEERRYSPLRPGAAAAALRGLLVAAPGLPAQAVALVALLYLAATDGGYYPLDWYPAGLAVLALLGLWAALVAPRPPPRRLALAATVLLAAFGGWALVSAAWAGEPGAAWDGANRALLYAALFGLFALWPVPSSAARWLVALAGIGIAVIGLVELLRWAGSDHPETYLLGNRLNEPVGYQNGNVALWLMGAFACLWMAAAREFPALLRGLALGSVPMLASLAWLGQSRGSLFALPVAGVILLAITPGRLRLIAALVPSALALGIAIQPALDIVDSTSDFALPALVDDLAQAVLLPSAVLVVLGTGIALVDRRWTPSPPVGRRIGSVAAALVAAAALAGVAVAATQAGDLSDGLSKRWHEFKANDVVGGGSARLSSGGTNRYDFWTVAWDSFQREPLRGVGMDNFQQDYAQRGDSLEKPRYPHSLPLAILSETGVVGALLLLAAVAVALAAASGARPRPDPAGAAAPAMVAVAMFAYLFVHASVDWLYELPALGGLAFAMLGLAAGTRTAAAPARAPGRDAAVARGPALRAARIAGAVAAAACAVGFALPWLAEREVESAIDAWRTDPAAAYKRLDRAASLNPLSTRPGLFEGGIAGLRGDYSRARETYLDVLDTEPRNSSAWLQLAVIAQTRRQPAQARAYVQRAARLAPRDQAVRTIRARIMRGSIITPRQANRIVLKYARRGSE